MPATRHYPLELEITFCVRGVTSPLLSNLVLDELDRELERRGHRFVRYADDSNVYVRSERAGQRVMQRLTAFITRRLKLKVNARRARWLGRGAEVSGLLLHERAGPRRRIAPKALQRFKGRVRELTRRTRGVSLARWWRNYLPTCGMAWLFRLLPNTQRVARP